MDLIEPQYTRRAFLALVVFGIAWFIWLTRLPQIGIFLIAAGWRRRFGAEETETAAMHATEWSAGSTVGAHSAVNSTVAVTYHPWYESFRIERVKASLSQAADLGVGYLRTDVRWSDVFPDGAAVDEAAFEWYRAFFTYALGVHGLKPLIVLANPPKTFETLGPDRKHDSWRLYVAETVSRLGHLCDVYQVMNEPNNPVYRFFSSTEIGSAVAAAGEAIREQCPKSRLCVNVTVDWFGWKDTLKLLCMEAGEYIDILGLDHYPGTWAAWSDVNWKPVRDFLIEVAGSDSSSVWHGRQVALMETGYSTNLRLFRDEGNQTAYYRALGRFLASLPHQAGGARLALVGLYELVDWDSGAFLDPEAHFGLLTSGTDGKRKEAFEEVKAMCRDMARYQVRDG